MAKTPDFLNALPSVQEILEDPRVRSIADRLNRSVATTRVRGYLERLTAETKRRSAEVAADAAASIDGAIDAAFPRSMRDLVDRVSRYLTQGDPWRVGAAINATGRLRGGPWASAPLSAAAIERLLLATSDFTACGAEDPLSPAPSSDAVEALCRAADAPAAALLNRHSSAIFLCLASLAEGSSERRKVVVARGDLITLDEGPRVGNLIERAGLRVIEVGASDGATLDDYASAIDGSTAAVLRVRNDNAWPTPPRAASTTDLASLTKQHGATLIEDASAAALLDLTGDMPPTAAVADALAGNSVAALFASGADLVIARGDGLIGGPPLGVVVGSANAIGKLNETPLAPMLAADPNAAAALATTIDQLADTDRFWFTVPVWSLLTTPIENLVGRAERMAAQLEAIDGIASAEVCRYAAAETPPNGLPIRLPTAAIAVTVAEHSADQIDNRLRRNEPALWSRKDAEGRQVLDLRTVLPRQDQELVHAVAAVLNDS